MATLTQIRDKADTKLAQFWLALQSKQDSYFAKHGTYFGFNWTPSLAVIDGVDTQIGEINRPSRKHVAVDVQFPTTDQVPYQIQVMRSDGPAGHGYKATVKVQLNDGRIFTRTRDSDQVDSGWVEYNGIDT